jgi:hypothetical protein
LWGAPGRMGTGAVGATGPERMRGRRGDRLRQRRSAAASRRGSH